MAFITTAATSLLIATCKPIRASSSTMSIISSSSAAAEAAATRIQHLSTNTAMLSAKPLYPPKRILVIRHGQAEHNPRAEAARENGCSWEEFLRLMSEDDAFDAALTSLGEQQAIDAGKQHHVRRALRNVELVVSSPMSRALKTADLVHPPADTDDHSRIAIEEFREINGLLLNAQRRERTELETHFPHWNFDNVPPSDESWTEELEEHHDCGERGYKGLVWLLQQPQRHILICAHGGILRFVMNDNSNVVVLDGRRETQQTSDKEEEEVRCSKSRFSNCEVREYIMTAWESTTTEDVVSSNIERQNGDDRLMNQQQPVITLEEVCMKEAYINNGCSLDEDEKVEMM